MSHIILFSLYFMHLLLDIKLSRLFVHMFMLIALSHALLYVVTVWVYGQNGNKSKR